MEKIIYIENDEVNKFNSLQELYNFIFGEEYFKLREEEKCVKRYEIAFYKIKFHSLNYDIVNTKMGVLTEQYKIINKDYNIENSIIIDNDKSFILSLCKFPNILIIENTKEDLLISKEEKEKYIGNYVIVNNFIKR